MTNPNRPVYRSSAFPVGFLIPAFLIFLAGFWPFAVWHGCKYSGGSGLSACGAGSQWVWTGQTWIAQGIWWAILIPATVAAVAGLARRRKP